MRPLGCLILIVAVCTFLYAFLWSFLAQPIRTPGYVCMKQEGTCNVGKCVFKSLNMNEMECAIDEDCVAGTCEATQQWGVYLASDCNGDCTKNFACDPVRGGCQSTVIGRGDYATSSCESNCKFAPSSFGCYTCESSKNTECVYEAYKDCTSAIAVDPYDHVCDVSGGCMIVGERGEYRASDCSSCVKRYFPFPLNSDSPTSCAYAGYGMSGFSSMEECTLNGLLT